jgi:microcystin-dependent protein
MARVAFPLVLQSPSSGSAIVGATATITQHVVGGSLGSGPPATIYTSETGVGTTASNEITTDNMGRWTQGVGAGYAQYWLAQGTYDIVVSGTGLTAYAITRELHSAGQSDEVALAGEVKWGAWAAIPAGFFDGDGSAVSRSAYPALFNAVTVQTTGTTANTSSTITAVPTAAFTALAALAPSSGISLPISGPGIPSGTRITGYNAGAQTLALSQPATAGGTGVALVIAPHGVGDGSTTFNVPLLRQRVLVASDQGGYVVGASGGAATVALSASEMPVHNHGSSTGGESNSHIHNTVNPAGEVDTLNIAVGGGGQQVVTAVVASGYTVSLAESTGHNHPVSPDGGGGSHNNLQPYVVLRGIIRHGAQ